MCPMGSDFVFVFLFIMCGRGFPFLLDLSESSRPLLFSALDSGLGGPGLSPGQGHCVVFLGKTLYSHSASLHPGVQMGTSKCARGNPAMD